jgi:hypothetical protein
VADKNFKVKSGLNIPITSAAILTTDANGNISSTATLPIANGGTGQTSANNALNALLPIQDGGTVNYSLQSGGTNVSWVKLYNQTIKNAGTSVNPRGIINFVGATLTDDSGSDTTTITFTDAVGVSKSGGDTITASSASVIPVIVKGAASQTADLQQWQNSGGTVLSAVNALGQGVFTNTTPIASSAVSQSITAVAYTSTTATYTYSATAQTILVGEYVKIAGVVPSGYNGTYQVTAGATVSAGTSYSFTISNSTNATVTTGTGTVFPSASVSIATQNKAHTGLIIKAVSGQTASVKEIQDSAGNPVTWWDSAGGMTASQAVVSTLYSGGFMNTGTLGYFNATTFSAAVSPVVVRGAASQTADLQKWQNSAGTVLAAIEPTGSFYGSSITAYGILTSNSSFRVNNASAGTVAAIIKGAASQTANLQEWQNSSGTVLASINASGNLMVQDLTVNGTTTTINSTTLTVDDKNIELASVDSPTDTTADGAGITIKGATDKTFNWVQSTAAFTSSEPISAPAFKSAGTAVSSNITLVSGYKYFVDTASARTLTLPASPSLGDEIVIYDAANNALTNNITVASNSNKLQGSVQDLIIDSNAAVAYLAYTGSTYGWAVN